jgi:uncharacterized Zn finger protein (UPF0148 family)
MLKNCTICKCAYYGDIHSIYCPECKKNKKKLRSDDINKINNTINILESILETLDKDEDENKTYYKENPYLSKNKITKKRSKDGLTFAERKNNLINQIVNNWKVIDLSDDPMKVKVTCMSCGTEHEFRVPDILNNKIKKCKCNKVKTIKRTTMKRVYKNLETKTSKYKGVLWDKSHNSWKPQITCKNKKYNLGYFKSDVEASIIRLKAEKLREQYINNEIDLIHFENKIKLLHHRT